MLFKILVIALLLYFAVRAVLNLTQAVLADSQARRQMDRRGPDRPPTPEPPRRAGRFGDAEIEDVRWRDL